MNDREQKLITEKWEAYCNEINAYHKADGTWGSKKNSDTYSLTKNAEKHLAKDSEVEIGKGKVTKNGKLSPRFGMAGPNPDKACGRLRMSGEKKKKTRSCKDYPETYKEELLAEPEIDPQEVSSLDTTIRPPRTKKTRRKPIKVKIYKKKREIEEKDDRKERKPDPMREMDKVLPGYSDLKRLSRGITEGQELEIPLADLLNALVSYILEDPSRVEQIAPQLNKVGLFSRHQLKDKCRSIGRYSLSDWTEIQNRQALAQKGELNKPTKPK